MHITQDQLDEIRARLAQRPPNDPFTSAEAAIYTGRSTRTLKRAIDAGVGPKREKNPDVSGLAATNRHTRYRKAELDAWRDSLVSFATGFRDFDDLAMDAPWVIDHGQIAGHLLDQKDMEAVLRVLAADAVVFLQLDEALGQAWTLTERRQVYQEVFQTICERAVEAATVAGQRAAMQGNTEPAQGESGGPVRP